MKKIIAILLISTGLNAQDFEPTDVHLHIGATYIISSVGTSYVLKKTNDKKKAMLIGIGVGMAVGIAKELHDSKSGHYQNKDLFANLIGSTLGSIVVTIPFWVNSEIYM